MVTLDERRGCRDDAPPSTSVPAAAVAVLPAMLVPMAALATSNKLFSRGDA